MKIRVERDIRPLSEFRTSVAAFVKQVRETGRAMILTQRGRGVKAWVDPPNALKSRMPESTVLNSHADPSCHPSRR